MFRHRPAMAFGVVLAGGILIGWLWSLPAAIVLAAALLLGALSLVVRPPAARDILLLAAIAGAGLAKISADARLLAPNDVSGLVTRASGRILLYGRVSELPRRSSRSTRVVLEADSARRQDGGCGRLSGRVLLSVARGGKEALLAGATYGTAVSASGELRLPEGPRNPGEFDRGASLRLNDITAELAVQARDSLAVGGPPGAGTAMERFVYPARRSVRGVIREYFSGSAAEFLTGLITGERSEIAPEVKSAFITAGVMHILAVSGLHVVIVSMMLSFLLELFRVPERPRLLLMALILFYYTFFTGATASVARSVLMALVLVWAPSAGRKADIYNALAASAIVVLWADARQLFQPGFQLSYAAVFALVYLSPKVTALGRFVPERVRRTKAGRMAGEALAVSVAAGIGTIPIGAAYFGKISLVGFAANIVVVPLSNLILSLGMLTVAAAYVWPWLAGLYAGATALLTWLLLRSVELLASLPSAALAGRFGAQFFVGFYALLGLAIAAARPERRPRALLAALACACGVIWWSALAKPEAPFSVTVIDVGQGDAILVRFPHGKTMLVDGGGKSASFDAGERTVVPFLRWSGIDRLDAVVVTHPHADHVGGIAAVLRQVEVGEVIDAGTALSGSLYREYAKVCDSLGVKRTQARPGELLRIDPSARCYVLAPAPGAPASGDSLDNHALNNCSVVLKVVFGGASILLSGDAEEEVERALVERYGTFLRSGLLKAGHHGSRTSSSAGYLHAVAPEALLISVGARNRFGHPSVEVLARCRESGIGVARTDESGALVMASDGGSWRRVAWRSGGI